MPNSVHLRFVFLLLVIGNNLIAYGVVDEYKRDDFPADFVFGSGTSAYQVEGAVLEDGRSLSIWDTFAHSGNTFTSSDWIMHRFRSCRSRIDRSEYWNFGSKISGFYNGANGDVACDGYHKYKEDIQLMADTDGRGSVNLKGLKYYNDFIDRLISHGMQPHITLYHNDLPQILEDEYGGWLSRKAVKDYIAYADVCFREFGDRVLHWTTFNEANVIAILGYDSGFLPPGHCSYPFGFNCTKGDSTSEPYIVAHHLLLAHASTVRLYRKNYKAMQHGFVGINVFAYWLEPCTNTMENVMATERAQEFYVGWFLNPLVNGDYPEIMKKNAGNRIPNFTKLESERIEGAFDFFGINHYNTICVKDNPSSLEMETRDFIADMAATPMFDGSETLLTQIKVDPMGLQKLLNYLKDKYGNPPIYIHENGQVQTRNGTLIDNPRVEYLHAYIGGLLDAIRNGSNTMGYFVWSFLDLFELMDGYLSGYGLYYVDLDDKELTRYPKLSAHWYAGFLKGKNLSGIFENVDAKETLSSTC